MAEINFFPNRQAAHNPLAPLPPGLVDIAPTGIGALLPSDRFQPRTDPLFGFKTRPKQPAMREITEPHVVEPVEPHALETLMGIIGLAAPPVAGLATATNSIADLMGMVGVADYGRPPTMGTQAAREYFDRIKSVETRQRELNNLSRAMRSISESATESLEGAPGQGPVGADNSGNEGPGTAGGPGGSTEGPGGRGGA